MRLFGLAVVIVLSGACSSSVGNKCVEGASVACACPSGATGAQVCQGDGTFGPCSCGGGSGGNGGKSGSGGGVGSGGNLGSGGVMGSGGVAGSGGAKTVYAQATLVYGGTVTRELKKCYSCRAYISADGSGSGSFQMEDGYSLFLITVKTPAGAPATAELVINEYSDTVPAIYQGTYRPPSGSSCITFTALDVRHGGVIAGNIDCPLANSSTAYPETGTMVGSFYAEFP